MLHIGFANKFYTLWDVSAEGVYTTINDIHYQTGTKTNYWYIQNLSTNEDAAIKKAKAKGCKNLTPDPDLRGRYSSWHTETKLDDPWKTDADLLKRFAWGKYFNTYIEKSEDADYLYWCKDNMGEGQRLELVKKTLIDRFNYKKYKGDIYSPQGYTKIKAAAKARRNFLKDPVGIVGKNINDDHDPIIYLEDPTDPDNSVRIYLDNNIPLKGMEYNGYLYYLPIIKGTVKRIKNKKIRLINCRIKDGVLFADNLELIK